MVRKLLLFRMGIRVSDTHLLEAIRKLFWLAGSAMVRSSSIYGKVWVK